MKLRLNEGESQTSQSINRADCIVSIWLQIGLAENDAEERGNRDSSEDKQVSEQAYLTSQEAHCSLIEALMKILVIRSLLSWIFIVI